MHGAHYGHLPSPERRRRGAAWALAAVVGLAALALVALWVRPDGRPPAAAATPPPVTVAVTVPAPAAPDAAPVASSRPATAARSQTRRASSARSANRSTLAARRFAANDRRHVRRSWVAGFYPIYEEAQRVFGVNWLLIASVHKQETAFSTAPDTYHGRNFAGCCAGPMQFNVTNGPVTTWSRFRSAHELARRPATYNHQTKSHPSIYDDFDAVTAGAWLLRTAGAATELDVSAWRAAYDYYGHDLTGVDYANRVVARAIGWGRNGFCINCEADPSLVAAVDAAWGAPVRAAMLGAEERERKRARAAARTRK